MNKPALKELITNNRWETLFKELRKWAESAIDTNWSNDIDLLEGQYNEISRAQMLGTVEPEEYRRKLNQLRHALLQSIDNWSGTTTAATTKTLTTAGETQTSDGIPPQYNRLMMWISLVLAALVLILTTSIPCPTPTQFWVFRVLLAVAAGGLTTSLSGSFNLNWSNTITATGALGVFAAIYFLNPAQNLATGDCALNKPFNFTVFVHGKGGKDDKILRGQGKVKLYLNSLPLTAAIDDNGRAVFSEVATSFLTQKIRVEIEHPQPYKLTHPDTLLTLSDNGTVYLEVGLMGTNKVFGTVTDFKTNAYLDSVRVSILDIDAYTNKNGWFTLNIPADKQAKFQRVVFDKKNYARLTYDSVPVHTQQAFDVAMKRVK